MSIAHITLAIAGVSAPGNMPPLLLAVSGGGDSMAMAWAFSRWSRQCINPPPIRAVVVDHGLRTAATDEAVRVKAILENRLGIPARIARIETPPPRSAIQARLRQARYALLAADAARDDAVIITAHHADDQAETVLMRARKASHLKGLAAMRPLGAVAGIRLLRPFLAMPGANLRAALDGSGIPVIHDPANKDMRFERVRLRHAPRGAGAAQEAMPGLIRLASAAGAITGKLDRAIGNAMAGRMAITPLGRGWMERAAFAALPDVAQHHLLAAILTAMMPLAPPVKKAAIARLADTLCKGDSGQGSRTLGGCEWHFGGDGNARIDFFPEACRLPPPMPLDGIAGEAQSVVFDGRWRVFLPAHGAGAALEPLGAERVAMLRRNGFFREDSGGGIPARALWRLPVLAGVAAADIHTKGLEIGGIIPHLIICGQGDSMAQVPAMCFIGLRHFAPDSRLPANASATAKDTIRQ